MIKAISGGQTGCDVAALDAALACGFQTGGTMPYWFQNESGKHPEFEKIYGVKQNGFCEPREGYRQRTFLNVRDSDVTIWFDWTGDCNSRGYYCTRNAAFNVSKEFHVILKPEIHAQSRDLLKTVCRQNDVINFAGNRESKAPGIYDWVYGLLRDVFQELKAK
jgi:hypothetical protein